MCRIYGTNGSVGSMKLSDVMKRAGITSPTSSPTSVREIKYSRAEISAARKVLNKLMDHPSRSNLRGNNGMDTVTEVIGEVLC